MSYLGTAPSKSTPTYKQVYEYTATAGQTTFTASYTVGFVAVFRNGVQLHSADYTATNGTSVVLANACTSGDAVRIESTFTANVQGAISNTAGAVVTSNIADANVTQAKLAAGVAGTGPAFSAYLSGASQTVSTSTWTKATLNTEEYDTNNNFASNRFQPTVAGYYYIAGVIRCTSTVSFSRYIVAIWKNGTSDYARLSECNFTTAATSQFQAGGSCLVYLNGTTDYVELYGYITGTGTLTFANDGALAYSSSMVGCLVRAG